MRNLGKLFSMIRDLCLALESTSRFLPKTRQPMRQRNLKLIDKARLLVAKTAQPSLWAEDGQTNLDEESIPDPSEKFRETDPDTSRKAAFANLPLKGTQRREILDIHLAHPGGLTDDEVHNLTPMVYDSLTTRRSELAQGGFLADSGLTRKTRNGIEAVVWQVTLKALSHPELCQ